MRLIGYATAGRRFFGTGIYVPLGPLTVLLGANDAGKSTLLRAVARDLAPDPVDHQTADCAFYFEAGPAELAALCLGDPPARPVVPGGYHALPAASEDSGSTEARLQEYVTRLKAGATSDGFDVVLDALAKSSIVCLTRDPNLMNRDANWQAFWCLPPLGTLRPEVAAGLRASDLHQFAYARATKAGEGYRRPIRVEPTWLEQDDAPVIVAPLAESVPASTMPKALSVPAAPDALRAALLDTLRDLAIAARYAAQDAHRNHELDADDLASRERMRVLLESTDDGGARPLPAVAGAVRVLNQVATRHLPDFVSAHYTLHVSLAPVEQWFDSDIVLLEVRSQRPPSHPFPLDAVADGLKLWFQLALLAGAETLARVSELLAELGEDAAQAYDEARYYAEQHPDEDMPSWSSPFDELVEQLSSNDPLRHVEAALARESERAARFLRLPSRVLLADEPEQHLNPRLQRRAARWLHDELELFAPCIAASHSAAFLSLTSPQMVHVRRSERQITCAAFAASEAGQLDAVARDLGFDRGELLSAVSCLMLVEGEHEIAMLDGLFGRELREAKVSLVAMHGSPPKGMLEVDALWRFTKAAVVVCLDNVRLEMADAATDGDADALRELAQGSNEEKIVVDLIYRSRRYPRPLEVIGHPGEDLIDALDPRAVRQAYPGYPESHAVADAAYRNAVAEATGTSKPPKRKPFYEKTYKLPTNRDAYARIAAEHRAIGSYPKDLRRVVDRAIAAAERADLAALGLPEMIAPDPIRATSAPPDSDAAGP